MPKFPTLKTTGAGEKVVNLGKMRPTAALVRPTSWLLPPASVEAITLQLPSGPFVVFEATTLATLLITELTFARTFLTFTMTLALPLFALLVIFHHTGQLRFFERLVLGNARHVDPFTIVVFEFFLPIIVRAVYECPCRSTRSHTRCPSSHRWRTGTMMKLGSWVFGPEPR